MYDLFDFGLDLKRVCRQDGLMKGDEAHDLFTEVIIRLTLYLQHIVSS